jgi:hypothetical protein
MKNKDDIGLFEAYNQVVDTQQLIEEGWWDRLKARTSGVAGSAKPMERIGAGVASGLGKIAGKFSPEAGKSLQQVGAEGRKKIAAAGQTSKISCVAERLGYKLRSTACAARPHGNTTRLHRIWSGLIWPRTDPSQFG